MNSRSLPRHRPQFILPWPNLSGVEVIDIYDVPYLGGYSKNGVLIYIDRHLARARPEIAGAPYGEWITALVAHEVVEKRGVDDGRTYLDAHCNWATPSEHAVLRRLKIDPKMYEQELRPWIKAAELERITNPPINLDCAPYRGIDDESQELLAHLRKCGVVDAK